MLSEQSVLGTHEVSALTCNLATHLGLQILAQGKNARIHEHLICNITDVVMAKEVAGGYHATKQLPHARFFPCNSPAVPRQLNLFHHRTYVSRLWEDSIRHTQNRASSSDIRIFEGTVDQCSNSLA